MRFIQDTHPAVVEAPDEEIEPDPDVSYVRERNQNLAPGVELAGQLLEDGTRTSQVLQNIAQKNQVIRPESIEVQRFHISLNHLGAVLPGETCHRRILFDPGNRAAERNQLGGQ